MTLNSIFHLWAHEANLLRSFCNLQLSLSSITFPNTLNTLNTCNRNFALVFSWPVSFSLCRLLPVHTRYSYLMLCSYLSGRQIVRVPVDGMFGSCTTWLRSSPSITNSTWQQFVLYSNHHRHQHHRLHRCNTTQEKNLNVKNVKSEKNKSPKTMIKFYNIMLQIT